MFSLADRARTESLLREAGFTRVDIQGRSLPVLLGGGAVEQAVSLFLAIGPVPSAMEAAGADPSLLEPIGEDLAALYRQHEGPRGVEFESRVWLVRAEA